MSRKIIYVFNPISGKRKKDSLLKKIEAASRAQKLHFEFFSTNHAGDYEQLKRKIKEEKITDVIIIGGDGTVSQITGALRHCKIKFGIIPAGSGNGLAYSAGIPANATRAMQLVFSGSTKKTDAFLVNEHYACMLTGLGFDAAVAHKFADKRKRGLATYVQQTLLHFLRARTYRFEIIIDNCSVFTDAYFISIANSNQFGNNVTIAPKAKLNDGLLDIVIAQKMNKSKFVFAVLKQMRSNRQLQFFGKENSDKAILYFQTPALTIKNLESAPLHIDGDPCETADELKINILKDSIELIRP
jgi:YegS/Rv2252/BmrU family lipid kinase